MTKGNRFAVGVGALLLALLYVTPMWRIDLHAPQYPEGLGLRIWVSGIRGNLQSINGLNHYIGMRAIVPDQIPELRVMPWVVAALIAGGLLVAVLGRRPLLYAYAALFAGVALLGLYDFWKWEYDYGHNLDPMAAIRIPGMTYQPPLIGSKALLNFHAASWPDVGGLAAFLAGFLVVGTALLAWRRARRAPAAARGEVPLTPLRSRPA